MDELVLDWGGPVGDHGQLTIVDSAALVTIAEALGLTGLPRMTRLVFEGGVEDPGIIRAGEGVRVVMP